MDESLLNQGVEQPEVENNVHTVELMAEEIDFVAAAEEKSAEETAEAIPAAEHVAAVEQPAPVVQKKKKRFSMKPVVAVLLAIAIALCSSFATVLLVGNHWQEKFDRQNEVLENKIQVIRDEANSGVGIGQSTNPQLPAEGSVSEIYAANVSAVVAIANEGVQTNIFGQASRTASSGSGFIISDDGYVVSNYHVIEGAQKLTVITCDGKEYEATVVGYDQANDVSLLKIEGQDLPHVTLGSSDALVVGDQVFAIGNPLGELTSTLTVGYVSAKERMVTTEVGAMSMIQTDAAINSGNSGGPLFNTKGEVVGITTAKYSGTSGSGASIEGIGFAIPIDDVTGILNDLKEYGYVTSAYLGVSVRDVDSYGVGYGLPAGAFIEEIVSGSPAEKAGLQVWDIIVNLGGHEIGSVNDLLTALRKLDVGQETTVTVYRSGQTVNLNITLEAKSQE